MKYHEEGDSFYEEFRSYTEPTLQEAEQKEIYSISDLINQD